VLSERPINRSEVILNARVIGGIHMVDHGEADDKIVAVLVNDPLWSGAKDIKEIPEILIERLRHYFATYKLVPGTPDQVSIESIYGCDHALKVVEASMADYVHHYGG
jgi:inorganic pyrophosphatase